MRATPAHPATPSRRAADAAWPYGFRLHSVTPLALLERVRIVFNGRARGRAPRGYRLRLIHEESGIRLVCNLEQSRLAVTVVDPTQAEPLTTERWQLNHRSSWLRATIGG